MRRLGLSSKGLARVCGRFQVQFLMRAKIYLSKRKKKQKDAKKTWQPLTLRS